MEKSENKIEFREIRSYEEAYYYNLHPESREKYNDEPKNNNKNSKFSKSVLEFFGVIFEGILEIIFSILE